MRRLSALVLVAALAAAGCTSHNPRAADTPTATATVTVTATPTPSRTPVATSLAGMTENQRKLLTAVRATDAAPPGWTDQQVVEEGRAVADVILAATDPLGAVADATARVVADHPNVTTAQAAKFVGAVLGVMGELASASASPTP